MITTKTTI